MTDETEIHVKPKELAQIRRILSDHLPGCEVRAFGSRVTGHAKPWSDLDLAVVGPTAIHWNDLGKLTEAFQASDLPFKVEVMDWHSASQAFQEVISRRSAVIQAISHDPEAPST